MHEYAKKSKPPKDEIISKLAASLPSQASRLDAIEDSACLQHRGRAQKKDRRFLHVKPRTISMVVEVDDSSTSLAITDSNGSSAQSSTESLIVMKNEITDLPLIEESARSSDVNGNKTNLRSPPDMHETRARKHKSWHGNGKVSAKVGRGIFTESPPSSQYFPVCRHYSSSNDDMTGQRSLSESYVDDCNEESEIIPMKILYRQRSFERETFVDISPRNCHSAGDLNMIEEI